jgi:hypothetical protein
MRKFVLGLALAASCALIGCNSDKGGSPSANAGTSSGGGNMANKVTPPAAADMTHVVTGDTPYYMSMPSGGNSSAGMFPKGTKVVMMTPMGKYSQVVSDKGIKGYVKTEMLDPIGK